MSRPSYAVPITGSSSPAPSRQKTELTVATYEVMFPRVLDAIASGATLDAVLDDDPRNVNPGGFMRWIKKDEERHRQYVEAKEIRAEVWAGKMLKHALADNLEEDVQRSKLAVDAYKWFLTVDNRKVYGDYKQVESINRINLLALIEQADKRACIDVTPTRIEEE